MATSCVDDSSETGFKNNLTLRIQRLLDECKDLLYGSSANVQEAQLLTKSLVKCQSCMRTLTKSEEKLSKDIAVVLLQDFSQAIMDKTYVEECRLVEKDFVDNDSKQQISNILDQLSIPERLGKQFISTAEEMDVKIESVLGLDMLECLCWRQGAILYMYCHTVYGDAEKWKNTAVSEFLEDSEQGVEYLQKMLNVRPCLSDDKSTIESSDSTTTELIKKGIFSDTHMLALMYAGEMCFWHWKALRNHKPTGPGELANASKLDSLCLSKDFLTRYISTVQGPLQGMGWDTIQAEQYLEELSKDIRGTT